MDLKIWHDKIINTFNKHIGHERDRASEAGADREEHGAMIELCRLNKTATAFAKKLHKMEADKRDDVLRSFDALRFELEKNWAGQRTPDFLDNNDDAVEPMDDGALPGPSYDPDFDPSDDPRDPEIQAEADDFEAALAEVAE